MPRFAFALALGALAGCAQILGVEDLHTSDGPPGPDAHLADARVDAAPVTLSGTVKELDGVPCPDAMLELLRVPDMTVLASDLANGAAAYALTAESPLDGVVHAIQGPHDDTYQYLAAPLTSDTVLTIFMLTPAQIMDLATNGGTTQGGSSGFAFVRITDAAGTPVAGAVVTTASGAIRYTGPGGVPDPTITATTADGYAWVFAFEPGMQTISVDASPLVGMRTVAVLGATATIVPIIVE